MGSWYIFCKRKNCTISSSDDRKPVFTNYAHRRYPQKYKADYQGYMSLESWILSYGQTNVYSRNWEFWLHYVREEKVKNIQKYFYLYNDNKILTLISTQPRKIQNVIWYLKLKVNVTPSLLPVWLQTAKTIESILMFNPLTLYFYFK